jgi:geranylgeranyl diphosphate synthase type I
MSAATDPFASYRQPLLADLRRTLEASDLSHAALLREQFAAMSTAGTGGDTGPELLPSFLCLSTAEALTGRADEALPPATALALLATMGRVFAELASSGAGRTGAGSHLEAAWGLPRTLNAGDAFYAAAQSTLLGAPGGTPERNLKALEMLDSASRAYSDELHQRLALPRDRVSHSAALLSAGTALGALYAGAGPAVVEALAAFGRSVASGADTAPLDRISISNEARRRLTDAAKYIEEVAL